MPECIRILVVDDHTLVRKGLRLMLDGKIGFEVIGEAGDGYEAVRKARELQPDVILLDLVMPGMSWIAAIHEIVQQSPNAKILVLTSFSQSDKVFGALKAGASGYLLKDCLPQELTRAIRAVHRGECSLSPAIARTVIRELGPPPVSRTTEEQLTPRELDVLGLLARGLSNREIAGELVLSERTVGVHISHILAKLHLANRTQAALHAVREGLSEPREDGSQEDQ